MKILKFTVLLLILCIINPAANAEKLKGKEKNFGFEFMRAKRVPIKFADEVDKSEITTNSLSFMLKMYISYPYLIDDEINMYLFDDKFTAPKYNNRTADYFGLDFMLKFQTPELNSYNDYLTYAKTRNSIYALTIDESGKVSKVTPIEQNLLPEVEKQIIDFFYNSPDWTPAKILNKDAKCVYMISVNFGHIPDDQGEDGWKKELKKRKKNN
ncbi:MAG: hypothetical protein LIO79_08400 [Rikenellaceae bacterium]|nr:hypothetical protein [Rikenellaceae bacterium]